MQMTNNQMTIKQDAVPVELAPLAGYSDLPFRLMAKKFGADVVTTEMISAKGLYYGDKKTAKLMQTVPEEMPVGVQIFGSDPDILGDVVARYINRTPFAFVDFNAGCPAPKIVKNGDGSALLKDLNQLAACVAAIKKASDKPVRVKMRLGWDAVHIVAVDAAKRIEDAGADVIAVHGRTRTQFYSGVADWNAIAAVKQAVRIPVIANGDIKDGASAKQALDMTGADGLMVGRGAVGNPFIFREIKAALAGETIPEVTPKERFETAIDHVKLVADMRGEDKYIADMRKQLVAYIKGLPGAAQMRVAIFGAKTAADVIDLLEAYAAQIGAA